jgi:hypothetical protein
MIYVVVRWLHDRWDEKEGVERGNFSFQRNQSDPDLIQPQEEGILGKEEQFVRCLIQCFRIKSVKEKETGPSYL